jgi:hypothetical protein
MPGAAVSGAEAIPFSYALIILAGLTACPVERVRGDRVGAMLPSIQTKQTGYADDYSGHELSRD